jgi:hypothetical protein
MECHRETAQACFSAAGRAEAAWRPLPNAFPLLPLPAGEEGRLNDMPLRENFVERVFHSPERSKGAYYRWTRMLDREPTPGGLVPGKPFPGRQVSYSAQADAHGPRALRRLVPWHYTEMGRLVAEAGKRG